MSSLAARVYALDPVADRAAKSYIRSVPNHVDRGELRHIAQIAAWKAKRDFDGTGSLDAWVIENVRWRLDDEARCQTKHATALRLDEGTLERLDSWMFRSMCGSTGPEQLCETKDTYMKALQKLKPTTRNIVERTLQGATGRQIAGEFGVDPSRVLQHLNAAKRIFAELHESRS